VKGESFTEGWRIHDTHAGSIVGSFSEELPLTNSLLIKSPVKTLTFFPFGAVRLVSNSDMMSSM